MVERAAKREKAEVTEAVALQPVPAREGLKFQRHFTTPDQPPFDAVAWERRSAVIQDEKGRIVFEQHDVEIPAAWSQLATNVVVSKYFRGALNSPERAVVSNPAAGRWIVVVDGFTILAGVVPLSAEAWFTTRVVLVFAG